MTAPPAPRYKLEGLDATRFWAALLVVLFHVVTMQGLQVPTQFTFVPQQFGRVAVPLFFTVSAFSLCIGYFGRLDARENVYRYLWRRFFRIAPLFYTMMIVYVVYLYAVYGYVVSPIQIFASVTFTFNLVPSLAPGFVWASWSVGAEMLFYLLLPLILFFVTDLAKAAGFFAVALFVSYQWSASFVGLPKEMMAFQHYSMLAHLHFFAGGILAYFGYIRLRPLMAQRKHLVGGTVLALALLACGFVIAMDQAVAWPHFIAGTKAIRAIPLALFVLAMALYPVAPLSNRVTQALGRTSYSLYLFHPLIIGAGMVSGAFAAIGGWAGDPGLGFLLMSFVTLLILIPAAHLGYTYIEKPGMALYHKHRAWADRRHAVRGGSAIVEQG